MKRYVKNTIIEYGLTGIEFFTKEEGLNLADKIRMEYMIMDSMTSEFRKMGGNLDNIIKDLNKVLVSLELSYISAASLIMCQNITDSLKLGKQITNNVYKLSIKLNDAKVTLANSDKDLAAAMGLTCGTLYRGNDDEDLNKVLKETDKTTKEVDGFLKEFDKEEEREKKAWYNQPAKEDIFDKIEYWVTGKKPRVRTQGEEVIAAQYTEMAFSNQNFVMELQNEFETGARGLASMDRINEVMENSEEMPLVNVGNNRKSNYKVYDTVPNDLYAYQQYRKVLMKEDIINNSKKIINGADLWDQKAVDILTKDGSNINEWWKMESKYLYNTEFGEGKIHYYENSKTGEVSSFDSKIKISKPKNLRSNPKDLFWIIDLDKNFIPTKMR
ncbi:hypothetical protein CLROS_024410 [Clostridium felsineum]|uniref:Uncharacterized protein n=1 Tax=Clostridium felsineum TaxID=36839 RepID=A0A1S8L7C0_9CLOT|nr:hypothetical protein CLAUR_002470 [Clostridium felsineum]URZ07108.1 hypothetical protein CLROS_024410 [Clostridium felsineum]URZ12138.1 hypothetical protein CROST_028550 [Clostridium felsineum]